MGYVSRKYLRDKWHSLQWDMDNFLQINNENIPDNISKQDVDSCINNIRQKCNAILTELEKA